MKRFALLTQDNCPNCERLKLMLAQPLRGQFDAHIDVLHRSGHPEEFMALAREYRVQATPALIDRQFGRTLTQTGSLGEVRAFLSAKD